MGADHYELCSSLPLTLGNSDSIWVIRDTLTKLAHFVPVKITYYVDKLTKIYIWEIMYFHEVHISIISDRGMQFTSNF